MYSVAGLVALTFSFLFYAWTQSKLSDACTQRYQSYLLADELRQSSDDLTRLSRTYVVSRDSSYEKQYMDILDIRNGKKARPESYHRIYWDFFAVTGNPPRPDSTVTRPLLDLMKDIGFTNEEFGKLNEAKNNSDGLVNTEVEAMGLVKLTGETAEVGYAKAREMMHNKKYHADKAKIMKPIDGFYVLFETRTTKAVDFFNLLSRIATGIFILTLATTLFMLRGTFMALHDIIGGSIEDVRKHINALAEGNFAIQINTDNSQKDSIIALISDMKNKLNAVLSNINSVMNSVAAGDFSKHVDVQAANDLDKLKQNVNGSIDKLQKTMKALANVMHALNQGDFSQQVDAVDSNVKGEFKIAIDEATQTMQTMQIMLGDITQVMRDVKDGDLTKRVRAEGRGGLFELKNNINQSLETTEKSLHDVLRVTEALSDGDLTQSIQTDYIGVFGKVKVGINTTVEHLQSLIGEVHGAADVINNTAKEIAAGNNDLSHRTEVQASSLQQTAASMEELITTVQQNTSNANNANKLALGAAITAKKGVEAVNNVVTTMANINESSHKIVDIITVIDDIAFQTNILALNAAVEAARAGEQGKGFAVVAVEVRNLEQRAASAAGEIKRLISDSVDAISDGSKQVEQAGKTMEDIVSAIQSVTGIMSEISSASTQQMAEIDQVHTAITEMDSVTQQNAALVEEAAAAAELLSQQTRNLASEMAYFKTRQI
ncbi:MAG: methyl-accepting chemotaxis protein [Methylococcaceae bacterium]